MGVRGLVRTRYLGHLRASHVDLDVRARTEVADELCTQVGL